MNWEFFPVKIGNQGPGFRFPDSLNQITLNSGLPENPVHSCSAFGAVALGSPAAVFHGYFNRILDAPLGFAFDAVGFEVFHCETPFKRMKIQLAVCMYREKKQGALG